MLTYWYTYFDVSIQLWEQIGQKVCISETTKGHERTIQENCQADWRHTNEVLDRPTDAVSVSTANKPHKIESGYSTKHQACCTEHQLETAEIQRHVYKTALILFTIKIVQSEFIGER